MGSHKKLTLDNRKCIETMSYDGKKIQEIADRIGVNRTTIDRELKRVPEDLLYNDEHAQLDSEKKRNACGATFIERKTRFYWTISMVDRTAESMEQTMKDFVKIIGDKRAFLSFTVDRGKEFSCWEKIENDLDVPMYFCDPYSPWQRGVNENGNGLLENFSRREQIFQRYLKKRK